MAQIHYVWWGKPAAGDAGRLGQAADAPSDMADMVGKRHKVHYWRQPGPFHPVLSGDIEVHELSRPSSLLEGTAVQAEHAERFDAVVETLTRYGAWAAAKDVLSFAVLLRHGGFYFDTTTEISRAEAHGLRAALAAPPPGPRVPFYAPLGGDQGAPAAQRSASEAFPFGVRPAEGPVEVLDCDVWAMHAPPGSAFCREALAGYLAACVHLGLDRFPARGGFEGHDTDAAMVRQGGRRDWVISSLAISSTLLGLNLHAREGGGRVGDLTWEAVRKEPATMHFFPQGGHAFLPALGLYKTFAGSWRAR